MNTIQEIQQDAFESEVIQNDGPVLVDFWAPWCGPCRALAPVLEQLAEEQPALKIVKLNIDDNKELAAAAGIRSIPTVMLFKDGQVKQSLLGVQPIDSYRDVISALDPAEDKATA